MNIPTITQYSITAILLLSALSSFSVASAAGKVFNFFYMGRNVCAPVHIKSSIGEFYVNSGDCVEGNLTFLEAWDCNGNKILDNSPDETHFQSDENTLTRIYRFEYLYTSTDNMSYGSQPEEYVPGNQSMDYGYEGDGSFNQQMASATGEVAGNFISGYMGAVESASHVEVSGYPYGAINVGMSRFYGEFVRMSITLGGMGGFHAFGGVGKDWIFGLDNNDKLAWHVGIGAYFSWGGDIFDPNTQAIKLDVAIGETPVVINKGFLVEVTYEHFFGKRKRIGAFGGIGYSLGNFKATDPEIDWDFQIGLAFKLWSKD